MTHMKHVVVGTPTFCPLTKTCVDFNTDKVLFHSFVRQRSLLHAYDAIYETIVLYPTTWLARKLTHWLFAAEQLWGVWK